MPKVSERSRETSEYRAVLDPQQHGMVVEQATLTVSEEWRGPRERRRMNKHLSYDAHTVSPDTSEPIQESRGHLRRPLPSTLSISHETHNFYYYH